MNHRADAAVFPRRLKWISAILFLAIGLVFPMGMDAAPTAADIINTVSGKYMRGNLKVDFTYSGAMGSGKGSLKSSGKRFALETTSGSTWYDGRDMWTYSPASRETTLVRPTPSEVAEANPLSVLSGAAGKFKATFAPRQTPGRKTIVMEPLKANSGIKRVVVVLDAKTLKPEKIDVTGGDGGRTVLSVKTLETGASHSGEAFRYPASRYKGVKVVDLR